MEAEPAPQFGELELSGVFYRYANYDTPFWARPNTQPGRWHSPGSPPMQYLSSSSDAAWAELIRAENLRDERAVSLVRMPMWRARIREARIVDCGTPASARAAGIDPDALIDDDHSACQEVGRVLRKAGVRGVIAPSAALPGQQVIVLFGPRLAVGWDAQPKLASAVPASIVGVGAPPPGLVDRVRLRGDQ